jgi:hypothetical protein
MYTLRHVQQIWRVPSTEMRQAQKNVAKRLRSRQGRYRGVGHVLV